MIAILSVFYAHEQASISRQQLERQTKLERQKALAIGVHMLARVQSVLGGCLASKLSDVEACGVVLAELRNEADLAAAEPTLATDYPLVHIDLSALYLAVNEGKASDAIRIAASLQRNLAAVARDLDPYDGATHLRLGLHASDLEADAALVSRFAAQNDTDEGRPTQLPAPKVTH